MVLLLLIPLSVLGFTTYSKTDIFESAVIQKEDLEKRSSKFKKIFADYEHVLNEISASEEAQYQTYSFTNSVDREITNMPLPNDPVKMSFYESHFLDLESQNEYTLNLYMATEQGEFYLSNIPPSEVNLNEFDPRQREWYVNAKEANGEVIWTAPYIDTGTGKSTITLAKTVKDPSGQVIGVVGLDFDMHKLAILLRQQFLINSLIVAGVSVIVGLLVVFLFVRNINRPMTALQDGLSRVSNGDLTVEAIDVKNKDEFGELVHSFNSMVTNLNDLLKQVVTTSEQVAASSEQLSANADETSKASEQIAFSIQEVSGGAETQLTQVESTIKLVNHISNDLHSISERVDEVSNSSGKSSEHSAKGDEVVTQAIHQMEIIDKNTAETGQVIQLLNEKALEIEQILSLINGIAEQTNLLALNAAIEAARAGEHGKGFAVVADEVRKLAEQSSQSTKQINDIIRNIQENTNRAVSSMKEGENAVKKGKELVNEAGGSFKVISSAVGDVSSQILNVSNSIKQINTSAQSLVDYMDTMNEVTEKTSRFTSEVAAATEEQSASMEEVSAATRVLANMAQTLHDVAGKFKM
ncbi:methyl-accepting chemotaxis protein [Bacillus salitolerans]